MSNTKIAKPEDVQDPDWLLNMDWDEYETFAAIGYSPENIAMYYKVDKLEFMYYYMQIDSSLEFHYKRGILVHQAEEGITMINDARSNVTQAQRIDKLRKKIDFQNARDEIIYGGI